MIQDYIMLKQILGEKYNDEIDLVASFAIFIKKKQKEYQMNERQQEEEEERCHIGELGQGLGEEYKNLEKVYHVYLHHTFKRYQPLQTKKSF